MTLSSYHSSECSSIVVTNVEPKRLDLIHCTTCLGLVFLRHPNDPTSLTLGLRRVSGCQHLHINSLKFSGLHVRRNDYLDLG